jgi:RNA 3'-terminal phosphate cyclase-like protein
VGDDPLVVPEDVGTAAARLLLDEVSRGGVVDGGHQGLLLLLAALGPEAISQVGAARGAPLGASLHGRAACANVLCRRAAPIVGPARAPARPLPSPSTPQVRLGPLTPHAVRTLRHIREFFGVLFDMKTDPATSTIVLSCVGCGLKNLSRKIT